MGLVPKRAELFYEKSVCKPGLLVVQANVKGFAKPWRGLIDSGASGNYARGSTLEGSQLYADISVRLATETLVTVSEVAVDLEVKFENFDSLVLDLNSGALVSHEPISARKQKRFWREHEAEAAVVQDIGTSEVVSNEVAVCPEGVRGAARYPLSGAGQVNDQLLGHGEDERGVARNPLSGTDLVDGLPLRGPRVAIAASRGIMGAAQAMQVRASVTSPTSDEVSNVTSGEAPRDCCEQLYTLVNGVTGEVEDDISLDTLTAADALLVLDDMSIAELGEALKAGTLAEVVLLGSEEELNSSSVDDAVLEDTKKALSSRSGSAVLKKPSDPFYSVVKEYGDVDSKTPPMGLRIEACVLRLTWFLEPNTA
ncbi:hypothetical protein PInf_021953 [Phytophthora infestans]|nr:hypothetical protein PInf_021953 [Phytophthora infestans]